LPRRLGSVTLTPDMTGGVFEERGRFPEIREIKQLIRDRVAPRSLARAYGHPLTT
jgi:predicted Rdx family selenoprotein